jgi:uncharacterized protein YndB with AHSA1/START domain
MSKKNAARRKITIERVYEAPIEDVWDLWTTKEGIESWWGPDGFSVEVQELDLRPGGALRYTMTAIASEQIEFMKRARMPLATEARATYTEVVPQRRLAYDHLADFIPGVAPYTVAHLIELHATAQGVRMLLTIEAMHDEEWTQRAVMGWESELGRLAKSLEDRGSRGTSVRK